MPVVNIAAGGTVQPPPPQGEIFPNIYVQNLSGKSGTPAVHNYGGQGKFLSNYDVLLLVVGVDAGSVVTAWPAGYVPIASITQGGVTTNQIAVAVVDGSEPTNEGTFTLTKSGGGVSIATIFLVEGANVDEVLSGSPSESQIAIATNSGTGTTAGPPADLSGLPLGRRLFVNHMVIDGTLTTDSWPANMPLQNLTGLFNEEVFVSAAQSEGQSFDAGPDHTWTINATEEWANVLIGIIGSDPGLEIEELPLVNPSADGGSVAGWTNLVGGLVASSTGGAGGSPEGFFGGGANAQTDAYQDVAVPSGRVAAVDENRCKARAEWYGNSFQTDQSRIALEFYDGTMTKIEGPVTRSYTSFDSWVLHRFFWPIPANTRTIRYIMQCQRLQGTNNDGYIDENRLWIHESH